MRLLPAVTLIVTALVTLACGTTGPSEFSDAAAPIRVKPGEEFAIVLQSNPTTGFTWRLATPVDENVVHLVGSRYQADPSSAGLVGSGGKEYWTFSAAKAGSTVIKLEYARAGQAAPDAPRAFTVEVR